MINVVLCGGSGTRLWPLSRTVYPKQFIKFFDNHSLFQNTIKRHESICDEVIVVTSQSQYFLGMDQVAELKTSQKVNYVLEPTPRNTAPALALSLKSLDPETIVLVCPSDHLIDANKDYFQSIGRAKSLAEKGYIITFGLKPKSAHTGYGYIKYKDEDVIQFVEKPNQKLAEEYIESGDYLWNSGIFCFKVSTFFEELKKFRPEIFQASQIEEIKTNLLTRFNLEDVEKIPSESFDYAVLENSKKVKVVPSDFKWNDIGSFSSLHKELKKDEFQNSHCDTHHSIESKNNIIFSNKDVATVGVENLIIVDTDNALLVANKDKDQKIKEVVSELSKKNPLLIEASSLVHRPWGSYQVLKQIPGCKIKLIKVKPQSKISLQKHEKRNEHWVVVQGSAIITKGEENFKLEYNQSTYIPAGVTHRLENPSETETLIIVESQVGAYVEEDDIFRIEDDYFR